MKLHDGADVTVVIVAYLSAEHVALALPRLLNDGAISSIIVVDNSDDPETEAVCRSAGVGGRVSVVYLASENIGFAAACNLGASRCASPYLVFLNPDVLLNHGVGDLREALVPGGPAVVAGSLLTGGRCSNVKSLVTIRRELLRSLVGADRSYGRGRVIPSAERWRPVPQLDGAFLMLARSSWLVLGGFDERFELYYEDVDFCVRTQPLGGCAIETGPPYGCHVAGASFAKAPQLAYIAMRVSRIRFLRKHHGRRGSTAAVAVAALEWLSRTVTRQPEGGMTRWLAIRAQFRELRAPGTVTVLRSG